MPVPLPLPSPPTLRLPQCPHPNLVPLLHSDLPKRPGMAGPPDASRGSRLPAAGQLLPLGFELTIQQALSFAPIRNPVAPAALLHLAAARRPARRKPPAPSPPLLLTASPALPIN